MVGGMLRHLSSLRRMKRDNGWIETLLEESYNERMHLLTFMKMCEPGWFMKIMIIGAQGVFYNGMFLTYLIAPKIVHRFVGYLEEEAVHTYTRAIKEIEDGHLPKWSDPNFRIPDIAITVSLLSPVTFQKPSAQSLTNILATVLEHARRTPNNEGSDSVHSCRRGCSPGRQPHAR